MNIAQTAPTEAAPLVHLDFEVGGMTCASCVRHVEHAAGALPGVAGVSVNLGAERVAVDFDPTRVGAAAIAEAVSDAGPTSRWERHRIQSSRSGGSDDLRRSCVAR